MQCHYGKTAIQLELVGKKKEAKLARSKCISFVMGIPEEEEEEDKKQPPKIGPF